ncbi:MAG: hypothetical protein WC692_07360 [Erythrobacter sp.]|jgi:hypothetical protein
MLKIIFQGETLIINADQIEGYAGCAVIGECAQDEIADDIYAMVSPEHLRAIHAQKAVEAVLILSGIDLPAGILSEEAEAVGIDLKLLAHQVHAKCAAEREFEIARRRRKVGQRATGELDAGAPMVPGGAAGLVS